MFCTKCGSELPDGVLFCTSCGAKQDVDVDLDNVVNAEEKGIKKLSVDNYIGQFMKKRNKKLFSKGKIIIFGFVIFIAAGLTIFINIPKNRVMFGAYQTRKAILKEETAIDKVLGLSEIQDNILNGKTMQAISMKVKGGDNTWLVIPDIGFKGEIMSDQTKGIMLITGYPTYNNQEQFEGIFYRDKAQTVMAAPDLYDGYFSFDNATMKKEFVDSALNRLLIENGVRLFQDTVETKEEHSYGQYTDHDWKQLYKGAKVTKDKRKTFQINGKSKSCKGYKIVFSKKDLRNLVKSHIKYIENDSDLRNLLRYNIANRSYVSPEEEELEAEVDQEINYISEGLEDFEDSLNKDLTMIVYIGLKGRIVSVEGEYEFEEDNSDVSVDLELSLLGKGNPLDDVAFKGNYRDSYNSSLSCEFTGNQTLKESDRQVNSVMELKVSDQFGKQKYTWEGSLNAEKKIWDFAVKLPGGTVKAEGTLDNQKKGKSLQLDLDRLKINDSQNALISLQGSYSVAPLGKTEIKNPSEGNEVIDLFDMDESEIRKVISSVIKNLSTDALIKRML